MKQFNDLNERNKTLEKINTESEFSTLQQKISNCPYMPQDGDKVLLIKWTGFFPERKIRSNWQIFP